MRLVFHAGVILVVIWQRRRCKPTMPRLIATAQRDWPKTGF